MGNLKRLKSYSDYKKEMGKSSPEPIPTPSVSEGKLHKSVVTKQRMVKESAFKVGDDYKVKVTFDIPVSLISAYIEKVQSETGKNALEHFSESELAEQMAHYILKQHLNVDSIPVALSVGEDSNINPAETEATAEVDSVTLDAEFGDIPSGETDNTTPDAEPGIQDEPVVETEPTNDIDINDSDLNIDKEEDGEDIELNDDTTETDEEGEDIDMGEEEAPTTDETQSEDQDEKEIDLESDEVNLGEDREIDANKTEENEEEYEEITLGDDETIDDMNGVLSTATMPIKDMMFYLKHNGIDCSDCSDEDVVDIYNEISKEHTIGVDDDGNEVKPNVSGDDHVSFGDSFDDTDLF